MFLSIRKAPTSFFTWGRSAYKGDGSPRAEYRTPQLMAHPLPSGVTVEQMALGTVDVDNAAYFVLGSDGKVYSMGRNKEEVLGRPGQFASQTTWDNVRNPGGTGDLENVAFIAAHDNANGFGSAMAILDDGTLVSWGDNKESKLGIAVYSANNGPLYPGGSIGHSYLVAEPGGSSAFAYRSDGEHCAVGDNQRGSFGDGQSTRVNRSLVCYTPEVDISVFDSVDTDKDGVPDLRDLDSDNDGISDLQESGDANGLELDVDFNGIISLTEAVDMDGDGLMDVFEDGNLLADIGTIPTDSDGDGVLDKKDLDSDADGIPDMIENLPSRDYPVNDGDVSDNDADEDGIIEIFDEDDTLARLFGGKFIMSSDKDEDKTPDYLDSDSDNDGKSDTVESGLTLSGNDNNNDGIDDNASIGADYWTPMV